jgi:hypothetical protein
MSGLFKHRLRTYICNNREFIPNFGERRRQGETISTAFVESTINQVVSRRFVKKQQMQWTLRGRPSFAADQDEGPQRGSGRPIPPLVSKIQVATTNAGARAQGGLTPDFLALSDYGNCSLATQCASERNLAS